MRWSDMGWFGALRRRGSNQSATPGADLPRATGPARQVAAVAHAVVEGPRRRFLPTEDLRRVGSLMEVEVLGPTLLRPGEADQPAEQPMRRVAELTHLARGSAEHRDSLGHRGQISGPAVRGVSSGSGLVSELALSREVRRDGGDVEVVTVRWAQPEPVTPTVRLVEQVPQRSQGRSRISPLAGRDGVVRWPENRAAWSVEVAPGATLDLAVPHRMGVVLCVLTGEALVGDALESVRADSLAVLTPAGPRLTVATRLETTVATRLLVLTCADPCPPHVRQRLLVGADEEDLERARQALAGGAFGRLARLDG